MENNTLFQLCEGFPLLQRKVAKQKDFSSLVREVDYETINNTIFKPTIIKENDTYFLLYLSLDKIVIPSAKLRVQGGETYLKTYGDFGLYKRGIKTSDKIKSLENISLNCLLECKTNGCRIERGRLCYEPNQMDREKEIIITATYLYQGNKYSFDIILMQEANQISDWLLTSYDVVNLKAEPLTTILPSEGGKITVKITCDYEVVYCKMDSNGKVIEEKTVMEKDKDITNLPIVKVELSNNIDFHCALPYITCDKQAINAEARSCMVICSYYDLSYSFNLYQEKGDKEETIYEINCDLKETYEFDSLGGNIIIPLQAKKIIKFNNIVSVEEEIDKFEVVNDSEWLEVHQGEGCLMLTCHKSDKKKNREGQIRVFVYNKDVVINVLQKGMNIVQTYYELNLRYKDEYTANEFSNAIITLRPIKHLVYDNGREEEYAVINEEIKYDWLSSHDCVNGGALRLVSFDGTYTIKPFLTNVNENCFLEGRVQIADCIEVFKIKINGQSTQKVNIRVTAKGDVTEDYVSTYGLLVIGDDKGNVLKFQMQPIWLNQQMKNDCCLIEEAILFKGQTYSYHFEDLQINGSMILDNGTFTTDKENVEIVINVA